MILGLGLVLIIVIIIATAGWYNKSTMENMNSPAVAGGAAAPAVKSTPKDVFMHLLAIITLYASAVSFITVVFNLLNIVMPSVAETRYTYYTQDYMDAIRFAVSALIVVFPAYLATNYFLNKAYAALPEKRSIRVRKWLLYFTLFLTGLIAIGDVVALIYHLLGGGELTLRFILKVLTILVTVGSIFFYYLTDIRRHKTE